MGDRVVAVKDPPVGLLLIIAVVLALAGAAAIGLLTGGGICPFVSMVLVIWLGLVVLWGVRKKDPRLWRRRRLRR